MAGGRNQPGAGAGTGGAYSLAVAPPPRLQPIIRQGYPTVPPAGGTGTITGGTFTKKGINLLGIDVSSLLGFSGLPSDVISKINEIFASTDDINVAIQLSLAYVRGTPWYAQTYPGINDGISKGLFADERGYRNYLNSLNQVYQQYFQRNVTGEETKAALAEGIGADLVGRRFAGDLVAKTNAPDYQYLAGAFDESGRLSESELTAYGREQVGIDTPLGQQIAKRLQLAGQRLTTLFTGGLAPPALRQGQAGIVGSSLAGQIGGSQTQDVGY